MDSKLSEILSHGEGKNIEFKEFLTSAIHLKDFRKQGLVAQLKHRMLEGNGKAIYFVGVSDNGAPRGLSEEQFRETLDVLESVAKEIGARIAKVEKHPTDGKLVGKVTIEKIRLPFEKDHILVGTAGHVDHGKSTLVGCLITGELDDGAGKTRLFLDVLPHEIERGLSADLSFTVYGFNNDGTPIHLKNPLNKFEEASIVEKSSKLISFVDTVGHEPWLRTTIRGLVGSKLDYGLLTIAADDGATHVSREHLGILLAMEIPVVIVITKIDRVSEERVNSVEKEIGHLLKIVGKIPLKVKPESDMKFIAQILSEGQIVPIIRASAVTGENLSLLDKLFFNLSKRTLEVEITKPFLLYIDKVYSVTGVGTVVSGAIKQGFVEEGKEVLLGPDAQGKFKKIKIGSIEMHHYPVKKARAGDIVGISIKGLKYEEVDRGMILCDSELKPKAFKQFEAQVMILNHPTRIKRGYEPVVHSDTIMEAVVFEPLSKEYMVAGDVGTVRMTFKFTPHYIFEGQKILFREGKSKGIGYIAKILR
ncbi:MAG: GTP-binding protein [Euryarchaeota archaeon]|nr:GTP-binding protein [Euryarchaeota archaeon]